MALLLRGRLACSISSKNPRADGGRSEQFAPGTNSGAALPRIHGVEPTPQRHFVALLFLQAHRRPARHVRFQGGVRSEDARATCSRCAWAARVAGTVRKFNPDPRVAQMIDHFTQYVGSSPYGSPAVLCGIAHMQTDEGVWYPMGGTRAVPRGAGKTRARTRRRNSHRTRRLKKF